jgi:hypothetical protein
MKLRLQHCVFFWALCFLAFIRLPGLNIEDNDVWWHLRTGQLISQTHRIPTHDPFSYTAQGQPWMAHEWLSELLFYKFYARMGLAGVILLDSILVSLMLLGIYFLVRRYLKPTPLLFGVAMLCAVGTIPFWSPRPQLFTYAFLSGIILLLDGWADKKLVWITVPMFFLWSNLHGGWVIGFAIMGVILADYSIEAARQGRLAVAKRSVAVCLCSLAAIALGPGHIERLVYPIRYLSGAIPTGIVSEFTSPDFHDKSFLSFLAILVLMPLMLYLGKKPLRPSQWVLMIGFLCASLFSVRHVPVFTLLMAPILAVQVASIFDQYEEANGQVVWSFVPESKMLNWVTLILAAFVAFLTFPRAVDEASCVPANDFPAQACKYLANNPKIGQGHLLNTYDWGGYLIYKLYPKYLVSIDGRADVHIGHEVEDMTSLDSFSPKWKQQIAKRNPDVILWPSDKALAVILNEDPQWRRVYHDKVADVFVKR